MRRYVATAAALALAFGLFGAPQASATHDGEPIVMFIEGVGFVCGAAALPASNCTYAGTDPLWDVTSAASQWDPAVGGFDGLFWPGVGPPGEGPWTFTAGPDLTPGGEACVSSVDGAGCTLESDSDPAAGYSGLLAGASGFGPYCGSSSGDGRATFTSAGGTVTFSGTFGWLQSMGTNHVLQGEVLSPASMAGATLVGYMNTRGVAEGGNCGITTPTTAFQVEAVVVVF